MLLFCIMMELARLSYPWKAGITLNSVLWISYLYQTVANIMEGMRKLRQRIKPGKMSVREMIDEGRRF